jgi:hypothetical protein
MKPYIQFPEDETKAAKEIWKQRLSKFNKILKAKKKIAIAKTQKAYKMFRCFVVGNPRTQWDKIVHKMHTKDLDQRERKFQKGYSRLFLALFFGLH